MGISTRYSARAPSRRQSWRASNRCCSATLPRWRASAPAYALEFALQGQQGVECVKRARGRRPAVRHGLHRHAHAAGWDGLETIERLWAVDPDVQVVICSAHSDYDWRDVVARLGQSDKLLILKKPFEPIEVLQCASALARKWQHERALLVQVESLENVMAARTEKLEAANRQLRHLATHDALTGLPNRVLLDDRLAQAMAHADRDGTAVRGAGRGSRPVQAHQ